MKTKLLTFVTAILFAGNIMATELLSTNFTSGQGDWTISNVELSGLDRVWIQDNTYGMKASAYYNKSNHKTESWLISPTIDLSNMETATMAFSHAVNYASPSGLLSVKASADGSNWSDLQVSNWPAGNNWTFVDAEASLDALVGESAVQIAFVYTSTTSAAPTWEIKTVSVEGEPIPVKIGDLNYRLDLIGKVAEVTWQEEGSSNNYSDLTTANIPTSVTYGNETYRVTSIGNYAFSSCSSLTSVTIPSSVTSIGEDAFEWCDNLTSVTIPNSVTSIGASAFQYCTGLTSVTIGNSVTSIGDDAFYKCSSLTSVTIPNSVTSIGENAFKECSKLTSVTINSNALASKEYSGQSDNFCHIFGDQVKSYIIGNSVTSIGQFAFYYCRNLNSVTIQNSVTSIGERAFNYCTNLTSVTIGNSVTSIGSSAFDGCSSLTSIEISNSVANIANGTFAGCSSLTSVTIPNSVTSIGGGAFSGCRSLISVTIGNSVTSIGYKAFYNCGSMTSVTIPSSVTSIEEEAFKECSSLISVTLNSNAIVSHNYDKYPMLYDIFGLQVEEYILGESITSIGECAFLKCSGLISVTIPNSVTSIGLGAFSRCSRLTSVTIPNSVTSIGSYAFYGCSSLISPVYNAHVFAYMPTSYSGAYSIPDDIKSIAGYAFYECSSLTSVTIPNSVTSIGESAFQYCNSLTSVTNSNRVISIERYAFADCSSLTSVTIPNSVTSIGEHAFSNCTSMTSVNIGNSVTNIGEYAFSSCSNLTSITCEAINPPTIDGYTWWYVDESTPLYVPAESVSAYKTAEHWKKFNHIFAIGGTSETYTITFLNYDGTELQVLTEVKEGEIPVYTGKTPTRPADSQYTYTFSGWTPKIVKATKDATYTATFSSTLNKYTISANAAHGKVTGTGEYAYGTKVELTAIPDNGYVFNKWSDGVTDNPRTITVMGDAEYTSIFDQLQGVNDVYVSEPVRKVIIDNNIFILRGDKTYTIQGQEVR